MKTSVYLGSWTKPWLNGINPRKGITMRLKLIITLSYIVLTLMPRNAIADELSLCDRALNSCGQLVQDDDAAIKALQDQVKAQKDRIDQQDRDITRYISSQSILPTWAWVTLGGVAGAAMVGILKH